MRPCKSLIKHFPVLWISVLHISNTCCVSLETQNHTYNLSVTRSVVTTPKNLSELIEFSPLKFPLQLENIPHGNKEGATPDTITFRLKTHVIVGNSQIDEGKKVAHTSESPLSEIEYLDAEQSERHDFTKWISNARKARMDSFDEKRSVPSYSYEDSKSQSDEDTSVEDAFESREREENRIDRKVERPKYASARQFLLHPYLPYGKDTPPDEKISFHDILPIKVVKFIKSMVEEADWNGMFKSMVRTVVNNFVEKLIEKMFSEKDDHLKKRSLDLLLTPTFVFPAVQTPVIRLKRSIGPRNDVDPEEDPFRYLPPKRIPQEADVKGKKSPEERMSWLDHFLDFAFPNSKSNASYEESFDRLTKRDTTNKQLLKIIVTFFLNTFEKSSGFFADAKDVLRYKTLKEFLPHLYQKGFAGSSPDTSPNSLDVMKMAHRKFILKRNDHIFARSMRKKRSTGDNFLKDEDRLWQSHSRRRRPFAHRSHDECSLRKACNAGRLLSRLPSVQDITLQLRSNGNEPHWDALLWGMKKKRCSRIFCKRQRSPKGSKYSWNSDAEQRLLRNVDIITEPADVLRERDNLTV